MTSLVWDQVGDRTYESGIDRGVLYLPDGSAIPWSGLVSVTEHFSKESTQTYYDGQKISDFASPGEYSASLKAITYPDEFSEFEGLGSSSEKPGVFLGDQRPKVFNFSYRSQIGNDVDGNSVGYKIHVIYNAIANPNDKAYATVTGSLTPADFTWDISAIPEDLIDFGFAPSAHIIINTLEIDPTILSAIEAALYGTSESDASLPSMIDLLTIIFGALVHLIHIEDNNDGTWTATTTDGTLFTVDLDGSFTITEAEAVFLDASIYLVKDTIVRV